MKRLLSRLVTISILLVIIALIVLGVSLIATVLVVLAYGLGLLYTRLLPFDIGQATLLALIAVIAVTVLVWHVVSAFVSQPLPQQSLLDGEDNEDEDDEDDEDEWHEEDWDEDDEPDDSIPSIPRWRQPFRPAKFEGAGRNDPCPCGSGRKFKNCHGRAAGRAVH